MTGLGFSIDDKLYEEFSKLVDDSGYIKYRAVEGALRVFMALPPEAQGLLMSNNVDAKDLLIIAQEKECDFAGSIEPAKAVE